MNNNSEKLVPQEKSADICTHGNFIGQCPLCQADQKETNMEAKSGWAEYLKTIGNPMIKLMQEESRIRIQLGNTRDENEIKQLREKSRTLSEMEIQQAASTLRDGNLANKVGWSEVNKQRAADMEKFKSIISTLHELSGKPEFKDMENHFDIGTMVQAPVSEGSGDIVSDWNIVAGTAGHYVIERQNENGLFDDVICNEEELINWGNSY